MKRFLLPLALGLLSALGSAQIGQKVGEVELDDFAQTKAKSYDDLFGRAVLIEFFAYW